MRFYVVRHGQTDYNKLGVYQGQKDIPLNDVGIEQAIDMSRHLKEIVGENEISAILVSPLTRAKQTAEPVSRIFGIEIEICDDIKERGFGNLEGQKPTPRLTNQMMLNYNKNCKDENIEPIQSFFNRVYTAMDKIVDRFSKIEKETGKEQNIVLVTHAAVTIVLNCYFNGKPEKLCYETLEPLVIKNAEIKVYEGGKMQIKKKILFYYKLFFAGGIESSILKFVQKLSGDYDLYVMYDDEQSQNVVLDRISKYAKIINYNELESLSVDTCIWCSHPRQLTFDEFTSKVHASKYICWGHILLFDTYPDYEFDENFIKNVDKYINVSQTVEDDLLGKYPFLKDRSIVLENYMDIDEIRKKSNEEVDFHVDKNKLNIITTARIAFDKGYKRMKTLCDVFDKYNVKYDWYVLGKAFKSEVYDEITGWFKDNKNVHFIGYQNNVYPYIKQMDYAAILSDREANNLSISEAFVLGKPCIVSNFKGVTAQVDDGKTGIIISLDNTESNYEEKLSSILNDKEELTTNVRNKDCSKEYLMDIWAELFDDQN